MSLTAVELQVGLANVSFFRELGRESIEHILPFTHEIHVNKADVVFHKGDVCTGCHVLLSGQVKLFFVSEQGFERVLKIVEPGDSFGEESLFSNKPYLVSAQAIADTKLLHIAKTALLEEVRLNSDIACCMLDKLAGHMHEVMSDVESHSLQSGKQRIITYLLRLLPEGKSSLGEAVITLTVNKSLVASLLNLTQEHFSRTLHELAQLGVIFIAGREIHIPDVNKLRACAA